MAYGSRDAQGPHHGKPTEVMKKPTWRWIGEALLVFSSVLGAFWVEDYRHNKQEEEDYIKTLYLLRKDLYFELETIKDVVRYDSGSYSGWMVEDINHCRNAMNCLLSEQRTAFHYFVSLLDTTEIFLYFGDYYEPPGNVRRINEYANYVQQDSLIEFINSYLFYNDSLKSHGLAHKESSIQFYKHAHQLNTFGYKDFRNIQNLNNNNTIKNLLFWYIRDLTIFTRGHLIMSHILSKFILKVDDLLIKKYQFDPNLLETKELVDDSNHQELLIPERAQFDRVCLFAGR